MSKAEQRGLEAVPPRWRKTKDGKGKIDSALPVRKFYIRAYEQAEKDTIERAISWLKEHANEYIVDVGVGYGENGRNVELIVGGMCWEHLKKAMED